MKAATLAGIAAAVLGLTVGVVVPLGLPSPAAIACHSAAEELYSSGDYRGSMREALGEEDSAAVGQILDAREAGRPRPEVC